MIVVCLAVVVAFSAVGAQGAALPGSLVGWWKLDEGTGTTALDSTGNKHDGTLMKVPAWTTGKIGGALEFNGSDNFVRIPDDPALTFAVSKSYTLAAWAYVPQVTTGWHGIVCKGRQSGGGASYYGIWIGDNGGVPTWYYGTWPTWGTPVAGPGWYHLVVTQDAEANTKMLYLNGELDSKAAAQAGDAAGALLFGSDQEPGDSFAGKIDDVQLYNRAVTAAQVLDLMKGVMPDWSRAQKPNPADGAVGVNMPLLQWAPGDKALFRNVYLGTSPDLTEADLKAPRQPLAMYYFTQGLQPGATYYWRVDEIEADGVTVHPGHVWSFVAQALTAYYPAPVDKANDVPPAAALTWMAPAGTTQHHLYFGGSLDAVTQAAAAADKGLLTEATFAPTGLESLTTYYWRVDEVVAGGAVKAGPVWSFTTTLPVDDFEGYTDDLEAKTTVFDTWIDGLTNGLSGSTVGYASAPFAEQKIVHGGKQSMPLDYNNVAAPFYSEAERQFAPTEDWTAGGVETLVLYVRGKAGNDPAPLYMRLEDASTHTATVVHPDPAVVTAGQWTQWRIPLVGQPPSAVNESPSPPGAGGLQGVNLARVKKLCIGVGDQANPKAGGQGLLYLDDISLAKP
jgi:hypothetical protein